MESLSKCVYGPLIGDACFEEEDKLRSAETFVVLFSPFVIPRAIQFSMRYHNRARYYSVEFFAAFEYKLFMFEQKKVSPKKSVELCSSCFEDPPSTGYDHVDRRFWKPIEKIEGQFEKTY